MFEGGELCPDIVQQPETLNERIAFYQRLRCGDTTLPGIQCTSYNDINWSLLLTDHTQRDLLIKRLGLMTWTEFQGDEFEYYNYLLEELNRRIETIEEIQTNINKSMLVTLPVTVFDGVLPIADIFAATILAGIVVIGLTVVFLQKDSPLYILREVIGNEVRSRISSQIGNNYSNPKIPDDILKKINKILQEIKKNKGSPPKDYVGGSLFKDTKGKIRELGGEAPFYEYDINKNIPGIDRGQERIVIDATGRIWYTNTHYEKFMELLK